VLVYDKICKYRYQSFLTLGLYLKFGLYRISFYPVFGLDRGRYMCHCIYIYRFYHIPTLRNFSSVFNYRDLHGIYTFWIFNLKISFYRCLWGSIFVFLCQGFKTPTCTNDWYYNLTVHWCYVQLSWLFARWI
jgi:hypothetical protein